MANSRQIFVQVVGGEEILLNTVNLPMTMENQQFIINQYDVRNILDARISTMEPISMGFSPQHHSTLNQSEIMAPTAPTFGEKMQIDGSYYPFHYNKATMTNEMHLQQPTVYQSIGINTYNPTTQNLIKDALNRVQCLNAQQMMKRRKEMDSNFL